jgi:hypothetical protein
MNRLQELHDAGVSIWLDTLSRALLDSGASAALIADSAVTGATSNPTIFARAITGSDDYHDQLRVAVAAGVRDPRGCSSSSRSTTSAAPPTCCDPPTTPATGATASSPSNASRISRTTPPPRSSRRSSSGVAWRDPTRRPSYSTPGVLVGFVVAPIAAPQPQRSRPPARTWFALGVRPRPPFDRAVAVRSCSALRQRSPSMIASCGPLPGRSLRGPPTATTARSATHVGGAGRSSLRRAALGRPRSVEAGSPWLVVVVGHDAEHRPYLTLPPLGSFVQARDGQRGAPASGGRPQPLRVERLVRG